MVTMRRRTRRMRTALPEVWVGVMGFVLNAIWEFAQSSLYADHGQGAAYVLWTRLHCTLGDVLILLASFWVTSIALRSRQWPLRHPLAGGALFALLGLAYTIWSEWINTGVRGVWEYTPSMPTIAGIGITPILQWLVLPPLIVVGTMLIIRSGETAPS